MKHRGSSGGNEAAMLSEDQHRPHRFFSLWEKVARIRRPEGRPSLRTGYGAG